MSESKSSASSSAAPPALTIASASFSPIEVFLEEGRRAREELQERRGKRNQTSEPEPQRPLATPKPSSRRGKRSTQAEEQLPSNPKKGKLTAASFEVSAAPFHVEASSSSAAQPAPTQIVHLRRVMYHLNKEFKLTLPNQCCVNLRIKLFQRDPN